MRRHPTFWTTNECLLHERRHLIGVGRADDDPLPFPIAGNVIPKGFEVYSGDKDGDCLNSDGTPEELKGEVAWSVMTCGAAEDQDVSSLPRLAFSIEELSTIDFEKIPSGDR